jgi:hypothetical protein
MRSPAVNIVKSFLPAYHAHGRAVRLLQALRVRLLGVTVAQPAPAPQQRPAVAQPAPQASSDPKGLQAVQTLLSTPPATPGGRAQVSAARAAISAAGQDNAAGDKAFQALMRRFNLTAEEANKLVQQYGK